MEQYSYNIIIIMYTLFVVNIDHWYTAIFTLVTICLCARLRADLDETH